MRIVIFILACVTICLTGCYSFDVADVPSSNEHHVLVSNYGWYLFGSIPFVCGNASKNAILPFAFFRDDVTMDKLQKRFSDYADSRQCHTKDLNYHSYDTVLLEIPSIQVPIPYILCFRELQLSGVLE